MTDTPEREGRTEAGRFKKEVSMITTHNSVTVTVLNEKHVEKEQQMLRQVKDIKGLETANGKRFRSLKR